MKRILIALVAVVACVAIITPCYGKVVRGDKSKLDTLSYAMGIDMGFSIKQQFEEFNLNIDALSKAIVESLEGKSNLSYEESLTMLQKFFSKTFEERKKAHEETLKTNPSAVFKLFVDAAECEKISYAFGNDIGNNISKVDFPLQYHWLLLGFNDAWKNEAKMTEDDVKKYLSYYFTIVRPAEAAERSAKWLAQKEREKDVQKTGSGLLYKIVKEGAMSRAAKNDDDVVTVHYIGRLQDGTIFDASRFEDRSKEQQEMIRKQQPNLFNKKGKLLEGDKPIEFPLDRVIQGWTEGMKLVGPGGKIILYIPADLAYGVRGAGDAIGPNEALEFEVELIKVSPAKKK